MNNVNNDIFIKQTKELEQAVRIENLEKQVDYYKWCCKNKEKENAKANTIIDSLNNEDNALHERNNMVEEAIKRMDSDNGRAFVTYK